MGKQHPKAMKSVSLIVLACLVANVSAGGILNRAEAAFNELVTPEPFACDAECKSICCKNGGGDACVTACGCSGPCNEQVVLACDQQCKDTCCKSGGGDACVTACGCSGPCNEQVVLACDQQCKSICCKNGGGDACVTACGCSGPCNNQDFEALVNAWDTMTVDLLGGCAKPGDCGLAYQGCCFGAKVSKDACTCKLTEGTGEVGTTCSGIDKAGACGTAYTACCLGFKAKGIPCTCDVEAPSN